MNSKMKYLKRTKDRGPGLVTRKKNNETKRKVELEKWREKNLVSPNSAMIMDDKFDKRVMKVVYFNEGKDKLKWSELVKMLTSKPKQSVTLPPGEYTVEGSSIGDEK